MSVVPYEFVRVWTVTSGVQDGLTGTGRPMDGCAGAAALWQRWRLPWSGEPCPARCVRNCPVPRKLARCRLVRPGCRFCRPTRPVPVIDREGGACAAGDERPVISEREGREWGSCPRLGEQSELSAPRLSVWRPIAAAGQAGPGVYCGTAALAEPATGSSPAASLLLLVEAGQQAERALEHLRRDEAGGQALVDLQAGQHRLPDGPGLDGGGPRGGLITVGVG